MLPSLPVGPYRLEVKKEGFSTFLQSGIVLQVDSAPSIDLVLKVGSIAAQVQVEAAAAMVETQSTGVLHLWTDQELNPAIYAPGTTTATTQARRLLTKLNPAQGPYYGNLENLDDGGTASYNAMILSAEHRLSSRFMVLANYTLAHCISDLVTTELSGPIYTNPSNRRFDRGNCTSIDVRHNFNLSGVLQSPRFNSRPLQWIARLAAFAHFLGPLWQLFHRDNGRG